MNLLFRTFLILLSFICLYPASGYAQDFNVRGALLDNTDKQAITGASVSMNIVGDTAARVIKSDIDGNFRLNVPKGNYLLQVNMMGYGTIRRRVSVTADMDLGTLSLTRDEKSLKGVTVQGMATRAEQSGDTTSFNASAFKTNPDATAEDLLNKMPGISTSGGSLKVNGEEVKKVLVDGKPFFGDDPNAAIKNLPSEIIDKIQVFDRGSDQAQFTGFDDGNSEKTINIKTRKGRNNGVFGKFSAGDGMDTRNHDNRYMGALNLNFFNGARRISLVGLANNVNQQNFSADDLLGMSSGAGMFGGGNRGGSGNRGGGPGSFGGGASSNFLVNQQGGITQTQSAGINYSDAWTKKLAVSGSYFFNRAENNAQTDLSRTYLLRNQDSNLVYNEQSLTHSVNLNHRISARAEWSIDSNNSLFITPKISFQDNNTDKSLSGNNIINNTIPGTSLQNRTNNITQGYNFSNSVFFRHKFNKLGRTVSVNVDTRLNDRKGNGSLYAASDYLDSMIVTDQANTQKTIGTTWSGSINYTEPLSKKSQLQLNYNPSFTHNETEKFSTAKDAGGNYSISVDSVSNAFNNDYNYHRGGLGYRYGDEKFSVNTTLNAQTANLQGAQTYPGTQNVNREFHNILPQAMMNYAFSKTENIRLFYRTSTNAPSVNQLQNVIDNSNTLQLRIGNPNLKQDYTHSVFMRYGKTNAAKGTGFFAFANATITRNYIGNSTRVSPEGVQISMPVNLNGMSRVNAFANYSRPLKTLKSNLNLTSNISYTQTPSLVNGILNKTNNYGLNLGFVLGSNISENVDFTLSSNGAYTIANSSTQPQSNYNYYTQTSSAKININFLKRVVVATDLNHTVYTGLGAGYNQNFLLWNASLGYRFLKDKSLKAELYAFDILNQNNSISRTVNDYYVEDARTVVLQRYVMLRMTYTIRKFKGTAKMPEEDKSPEGEMHRRMFQHGPPPGIPGHGPGF